MVSAEDVISIYKLLMKNDIPIWLNGGWGIDALLGEQTRPHKDLDVLMLLADVGRAFEIFDQHSYTLLRIWEENRWVIDLEAGKNATAFVLHDGQGREFDAHAIQIDAHGNGIPAWVAPQDFIFTREDLSAIGIIGGFPVQCITPESQVICHSGYQLPENHRRDMSLLREKYGVELPDE